MKKCAAAPRAFFPRRIVLALLLAQPLTASAVEPTATAIEFYNTDLKHYFVTAGAGEAAGIDAGAAGPGWRRTGASFHVWANGHEVPGLIPVCRFYGTPGVGPNSHFYSASSAECETLRQDPGWLDEGIAFYVNAPALAGCPSGTTAVYRSYNNGYPRNDSNHRYTIDYSLWAKMGTEGHSPEGVAMCSPLSSAQVEADAKRLLEQATFGPSEAQIAHVRDIGVNAFLEEQFAAAATQYPPYPWVPRNKPDSCVDDSTPPIGPESYCARDNYTLFQLQRQFYRNALSNADQLRQRVAWALSQILVTSGAEVQINYGMARYQQIFLDHAFGNYQNILRAVTVSPVMGDYLNMVNNDKPNTTNGTGPNENYARELMQLFSIGVWQLNPDGGHKLDSTGTPMATYGQEEISGLAHALTGWTFPTVQGQAPRSHNPPNYLGDMFGVEINHDTNSKLLLNGQTLTAGGNTASDLTAVIASVFNHPNVGPFIGRQLIQKLVTSNPTPAYVARVAAVFDNNGLGVRGDLKAVVRAILTDPEARGPLKLDPQYGKLREPVLALTHIGRALGVSSDGVAFRNASRGLSQHVYFAPTVFNYYAADNTLPGSNTAGPEFEILNSTTTLARSNVIYSLLYSNQINPDASVYGATGTTFNLSAYQAVAGDADALAERMNRYLLHGTMSAGMKTSIVNAVNAISTSDPLNRTRMGLYLVLTSPHFQVER
ncbi:MAG: DUF1800 domain-containing protein [Betaproteobacteria bacterium]|nr:DUF1800 domain-containing protein [Betaproteobacteria bacterium]